MLKLSAFMSPTGGHVGGWRLPEAEIDAGFNFDRWIEFAQLLERGKFDLLFLADGNGIHGIDKPEMIRRNPTVRPTVIEPISLLSAIAPATSRIGLVATATTTYDEPFAIARRFAALDWISKGRAGWNVVTSSNPADSKNFNREEHMEHQDRFERATEFVDVVRGLWDSWEDDALVLDKATGVFVDPAKIHAINHHGKYFSVQGPLNSARPPQGNPLIVVAGGSPSAMELAARFADVIFTVTETKEAAQRFYEDVKGRLAKYGRKPEDLTVLPGASIFVAPTAGEADSLYARLQSLIPEVVGVGFLSQVCGMDLSEYPVDGTLPPLSETRGMRTFRDILVRMSEDEGATIRQLYQHILPARGHVLLKGDVAQVADSMQDWFESKACDGFNVVVPYVPGGLNAVVDLLVPELQRRKLFKQDYACSTLRENLGLERPAGRSAQHEPLATK